MDNHVNDYFSESSDQTPKGNFHKVIAVHNSPEITWKSFSQKIPDLCKGWFELVHLPSKDRIEFTRDFWLTKLPYHPNLNDFLIRFFDSVDDIGLFITQQKFDDPFEAHLIYNLKGGNSFFRGACPATEDRIMRLQKLFPDIILPDDYLAFLQIHDGFCKTTDCTGIISSKKMEETYQRFQALLAQEEPPQEGYAQQSFDPKTLIPFYESFGMPFFQCFWSEWYPEHEMGNVYYSGLTKTISNVKNNNSSIENMAFQTFTDWLMFYLERIE